MKLKNRETILKYFTAPVIGLVMASATEAVALEAPLDTPDIYINKYANDIAVGGTGLLEGSSNIDVDVPGWPKQVLLYWEGEVDLDKDPHLHIAGDDTIEVNGHSITGELISGPTKVVKKRYTSTYRADITRKRFIRWGSNSLHVSGVDITSANGAGVVVLHKNFRKSKGEIFVRDGGDLALSFREPNTNEQTFTVKPSTNSRTATLNLFASGVDDELNGTDILRTSAIDVTVGDHTTTYDNLLQSVDGDQWDTISLEVEIPAGEDTVSVQLSAVDNLNLDPPNPYQPASFVWTFASLSVESDYGCYKYALMKKNKKNNYNPHTWWWRF